MEIIFTTAVFFALILSLYMLFSQRGKSLPMKLKCLVFSAVVFFLAALWCVVYGPDKWVLMQAGVIIVLASLAVHLSSRKR